MTIPQFAVIAFILCQPFAVAPLIRSSEIEIKGTRYSRIREPRGFWTVIGITVGWLVLTDLFLVAAFFGWLE